MIKKRLLGIVPKSKKYIAMNAVTRAINDIDGAVAKVNLKRKIAKVYCDREIDAFVIEERIRKCGYEASLLE